MMVGARHGLVGVVFYAEFSGAGSGHGFEATERSVREAPHPGLNPTPGKRPMLILRGRSTSENA